MRIVIQAGSKKRVINGPYNICISKEDLEILTKCLSSVSPNFNYGWIHVAKSELLISDTTPEPWEG